MLGNVNLSYAFREITNRRGRAGAAVVGIAIGIALYVCLGLLADAYSRLIKLPFTRLSADVIIRKSATPESASLQGSIQIPLSNQPISSDVLKRIQGIEGIKNLSATLLLWEKTAKGFTVISGIDPESDAVGPSRVQQWISRGRALGIDGREVLLEEHFARFRGIKRGMEIKLGGKLFRVVGITQIKKGSQIAAADVYLHRAEACGLAGLPQGASNMLFAKLEKGVATESVRSALTRVLPGGTVSSSDNIGAMMKGFAAISGGFSFTMQILALAFAAIISFRILSGALRERAREIGLMRTIGWKRRDVTMALTAESVILGFFGGLLGIFAGYAAALAVGSVRIAVQLPWNLNPVPVSVGARSARLNVESMALPIEISYELIIFAIVASVLIGGLTSMLLARRMAKVKPMQNLRMV